jgi:peptide subunit release factor 1 (eRF1)
MSKEIIEELAPCTDMKIYRKFEKVLSMLVKGKVGITNVIDFAKDEITQAELRGEQRARKEMVKAIENVKGISLNGRNATINYIINLLKNSQ